MGLSKRLWSVAIAGVLFAAAVQADYSSHPEARGFVDQMVDRHRMPREAVMAVLSGAERQQQILDAIARPAERTKPWHEYRKIFLTEDRILQGVEFGREHREALLRAEQVYGVPPHYILAILGVETRYGRHTGRYRVADALATLAFDYPPRGAFFRSELEQYLLLVREQGFDPLALQGSYAGAMGYGQFIASSYRHYAVDFDGDGVVDILNNPVDAIGSVANYFARHGWQRGATVVAPAVEAAPVAAESRQAWAGVDGGRLKPSLPIAELDRQGLRPVDPLPEDIRVTPFTLSGDDGDEYWLALNNFYVISRYNHSKLYAMAVHQLAQAIEAAQ